jgi:hypothetical protein
MGSSPWVRLTPRNHARPDCEGGSSRKTDPIPNPVSDWIQTILRAHCKPISISAVHFINPDWVAKFGQRTASAFKTGSPLHKKYP